MYSMIVYEQYVSDMILIRYSIKTVKKVKHIVREVISLFHPIDYCDEGIIRYNEDFTGYYLNKHFHKLNTLDDVEKLELRFITP